MNGLEPDGPVEQSLGAALVTPPLSAAAVERIRTAVEAEWRGATPSGAAAGRVVPLSLRRRFARARAWIPLTAAASLASVGLAVLFSPSNPAAIVGRLSGSQSGTLKVSVGPLGLFGHRELRVGEVLRQGESVSSSGASLVILNRGGTLRVASDTRLEFDSPARMTLTAGRVYLEFPPDDAVANALEVSTRLGSVAHLGTEYEIDSDEQAVRIRVREGSIRFTGAAGSRVVNAGTELVATADQRVATEHIATYGESWAWAAALAPDYDVEGKDLASLLRWSGRELGRPIKYADESVRALAQQTVLHGSVRGESPQQALSDMLATTSLGYQVRGDDLVISAGRR